MFLCLCKNTTFLQRSLYFKFFTALPSFSNPAENDKSIGFAQKIYLDKQKNRVKYWKNIFVLADKDFAIFCLTAAIFRPISFRWSGLVPCHKWVISGAKRPISIPFNGDHVSWLRWRLGGSFCLAKCVCRLRRHRDAESVLYMSPSHAWNGFRVHEPSKHLIAITAGSIVTSLIRNCYY